VAVLEAHICISLYLPKIRMLLFEEHGRELALLRSRNCELLPLESVSVVSTRR
jgi:hypothetical protein